MTIRKKILFVSARLPFPAIEGHQIRALGVLKQLAKFADVHLLTILRDGESIRHDDELARYCLTIEGVKLESGARASCVAAINAIGKNLPLVVTKYTTSSLRKMFKEQIEQLAPDVVHLDLLPLAGLMDLIPNNIAVVLNQHNIESDLIEQKLETISSIPEKIIYKREFRRLKIFEAKACKNVDAVLACSDEDKRGIETIGGRNVHCIPNGVQTEELRPDHSNIDMNKLVFIGGMGWYPNRLGIEWFVNKVMPILVSKNSKLHLDLIGNPNPNVDIPKAVAGNITKLGFVDDFKPYVKNSGIMIVPLHVGSGTRLKVVEGASLGKCIVSTRKGAQGVKLKSGEGIIYADNATEFADAILRLHNDKQKILKLGKNARRIAEKIYDWDAIGRDLNEIYRTI
ncbi:MAG: glycosyltransferase family 4 protein [Colwellia sp.]